MLVQTVDRYLSLVIWDITQMSKTHSLVISARLGLNVQQPLVILWLARQVWVTIITTAADSVLNFVLLLTCWITLGIYNEVFTKTLWKKCTKGICGGVDCSQPLYFRMQKKKRAKRARSMQGWRMGFVSEASKKRRGTVDIFGKKWTYLALPPVITSLLTSPPLDH